MVFCFGSPHWLSQTPVVWENLLMGWLLESEGGKSSQFSAKWKMSELYWQTVEEGTKRPSKVGMLECIYQIRQEDPSEDYASWEYPKDTPFIQGHQESSGERGISITKKFAGQGRRSKRSSHWAGLLTSMGIIEPWRNRGQVVVLNCQKLEGHNYHNNWQGHSCSQRSLTQEELWRQLIDNMSP